jgi:hypothetical protein
VANNTSLDGFIEEHVIMTCFYSQTPSCFLVSHTCNPNLLKLSPLLPSIGGCTTLGGHAVARPALVVLLATEATRNRIAPTALETNERTLTFFVYVTITLAFAEGESAGRLPIVADNLKVLRGIEISASQSCSFPTSRQAWEVGVEILEKGEGSIITVNIENNNVAIPSS